MTPEKQTEALAAAETFMSLGTSLKHCQKALVSTTFAGMYIVPRANYIKPLYVCTTGNITGLDGDISKRVVAQANNNGSAIVPEAARLDITSLVIALVEDTDDDLPAPWAGCLSPEAFTKADLDAVPELQALIPDESTSYRLVAFPCCLPILFGNPECHRGKINDACIDMLDQNWPGSSIWARWVRAWKAPIHDAVLASLAADPKTLGKKCPKFTKGVKTLASSLLTPTETHYEQGR